MVRSPASRRGTVLVLTIAILIVLLLEGIGGIVQVDGAGRTARRVQRLRVARTLATSALTEVVAILKGILANQPARSEDSPVHEFALAVRAMLEDRSTVGGSCEVAPDETQALAKADGQAFAVGSVRIHIVKVQAMAQDPERRPPQGVFELSVTVTPNASDRSSRITMRQRFVFFMIRAPTNDLAPSTRPVTLVDTPLASMLE